MELLNSPKSQEAFLESEWDVKAVMLKFDATTRLYIDLPYPMLPGEAYFWLRERYGGNYAIRYYREDILS